MSPPLLDQLDDLIARTRRRLALRKLVLGGAVGLHLGLWCAVAALLVATQVLGRAQLPLAAVLSIVVAVGGFVLLFSSLSLIGRRLQRREVALLLDRSLDRDEVYVTTAWLGENPDHPDRDPLLAQLGRAPSPGRSLAQVLAIRWPKHLRWAPLAVICFVAAYFVPPLYTRPPASPIEVEGERLADRLQELDREFEGAELPPNLVGEVAELAEELTGDELTQEQAVDRINELQKQLEAFKQELEPSQSLLEDLEEAADQLAKTMPDLEEALRNADMDQAAEALEDLAEQSRNLSPEQKQAAGQAMRDAGQKLKESQDPQLQQAGQALEAAGNELGEQGKQAQGQQGQGQQGQQGQGQQGQGQQGQGQQGQQGLSPERVKQLQEQLKNAQEVGERLQQDQKALERAQRINGALEGSKQRMGGEANEAQGESSTDQGQEGQQGQGQQGTGQQDGEGQGEGQGQGQQQGQGQGEGQSQNGKATAGAGNTHTWEDQGESTGAQQFQDENRNQADKGSTADKHIDDFQRLYDPRRLQNVDALIANAQGQIDENGHQDVLPIVRTGSEETSGVKLLDAPEVYTRAAQDAIANETVPPGYRNAVKQYFDQME